MCGIAGITGKMADELLLKRMLAAQKHRGPDDIGMVYAPDRRTVLGHNRLSIIDLSAAGHQPMCTKDGRYWIVYNGEVYNYKNIRAKLIEKGYEFTSETDTEVILYAYMEWGSEVLNVLRGMFAFAIWDKIAGSIFLARDRFGIKPLFYSLSNDTFSFASEVTSLVASGLVSSKIDIQSLYDYMLVGATVQPRTILKDVKCLMPGHFLQIKDGKVLMKRYWDLHESSIALTRRFKGISYHEAVTELRDRLDEAARIHMISDVPVGAFLSGGIDSTAIVGLMGRWSSKKIKTYSISFESKYDYLSEEKWATLAARRLGTEHTNIVVSGTDLSNNFEQLIDSFDQPSMDGINSFFVSKAARKGVKVALSGLGGDEIFGGYSHFLKIHNAARVLPDGLNRNIAWAMKPALSCLPGRYRLAISTLIDSPLDRVSAVRRLNSERKLKSMLSNKLGENKYFPLQDRYAHLFNSSADSFKNLSYIELSTYLRDTLLRDNDVMSMKSSLEVRPMLLDHSIAEFVFALPTDYIIQKKTYNKPLFVDAVKDILPDEIILRPKMGFEFPLNAWLRTSLKRIAIEQFESSVAKELLNPDFRKKCIKDLTNVKSKTYLWSLFILLGYLGRNKIVLE